MSSFSPKHGTMCSSLNQTWEFESYEVQAKTLWPGRGQHILGQFDEESIVVYQAYNSEIAAYAVENQCFAGCPRFNEDRMTWIKTNFLWMMYRSRWGSKPNQQHILAIRLKREAFEGYLENARIHGSVRGFEGTVRLQWDPDHHPSGAKHPYRRAVQLGLKGVRSFVTGKDILSIEDISHFVQEQALHITKRSARKGALDDLLVAKERVYTPSSALAKDMIDLSSESS